MHITIEDIQLDLIKRGVDPIKVLILDESIVFSILNAHGYNIEEGTTALAVARLKSAISNAKAQGWAAEKIIELEKKLAQLVGTSNFSTVGTATKTAQQAGRQAAKTGTWNPFK